MDILRETDPLIVSGAVATLFLTASMDPWWTLSGAGGTNLLRVNISPFYLHTSAIGLSPSFPFAEPLGLLTRAVLVLGFLALGLASLSPSAWWRELAVYFGLSTLAELYLSFMLFYHASETSLLGAYGVVPPYTGSAQLSAVILGLDLNHYVQPFVTAGFTLPFYVGFVAIGFVCASLHLRRHGREKPRQKGVAAVFTPDREEP